MALALTAPGGAAVAQVSAPNVVPPDIRLERLPPAQPSPPPPGLQVPKSAPSQAPLGAEAYRFVLRDLTIEGATAFPPADIAAIYADQIGREISLAGLYGIADAVKIAYREAGYFLARVIVPAQTIADGQARLLVLEGYVNAIRQDQTIGPVDDLIAAYLRPVLDEKPLRLATLERALLLANDIPGVTVTGTLRPSPDAVGAAELIVSADRKLVDGVIVVDNFGDEFTGTWEGAAGLAINALTPFGERIGVLGFATDPRRENNEKVGQVTTAWRLGGDGIVVDTLFSYGDSNPGADLRQLGFESETLLAGLGVAYPFVRSRDWNLTGRAAFDYLNTDTNYDFGEFTSDRLRVLEVAVSGDARDAWRGATTATAAFRQGLPILDATRRSENAKSRPDGTGTSSVIQGSISRQQQLVHRFSAFATVAGQYAFNDTLADEEFNLGGTQFGRGYDFNELSGDHGIGFTGELQYTQSLDLPVLDRFQIFGFYDAGQVWDRGDRENDHLSSAGFGVRLSLIPQLSVEMQAAHPLSRDSQRSAGKRNPQFLFRTIGRF